MPNYLHWEYVEKYRDAVQIMLDKGAKVTASKIDLSPHITTPTVRRRMQNPCTIILTNKVLREIEDRAEQSWFKIYVQSEKDQRTKDAFPPSNVNAAPYTAPSDVVQKGSLHVLKLAKPLVRDDLKTTDNGKSQTMTY